MTDDTFNEKPVSIGELARRTGLSVRTIRFYCDEGVLESQRSTGGHRMFDPGTAVERVLLIRRLRALGLGLAAITAVLHEQLSLGEAIAAESADLEIEFRSLAWRRASLRAVGTAAPEDRAARLSLLAAVENGHAAHDHLTPLLARHPHPADPPRLRRLSLRQYPRTARRAVSHRGRVLCRTDGPRNRSGSEQGHGATTLAQRSAADP